jgi:hypothetical protein
MPLPHTPLNLSASTLLSDLSAFVPPALLIPGQRSSILTLDDFSGAAPTPTMWPKPAFEEKGDNLYELDEIAIKSPWGVSKIITSETRKAPEPYGAGGGETLLQITKIPNTHYTPDTSISPTSGSWESLALSCVILSMAAAPSSA